MALFEWEYIPRQVLIDSLQYSRDTLSKSAMHATRAQVAVLSGAVTYLKMIKPAIAGIEPLTTGQLEHYVHRLLDACPELEPVLYICRPRRRMVHQPMGTCESAATAAQETLPHTVPEATVTAPTPAFVTEPTLEPSTVATEPGWSASWERLTLTLMDVVGKLGNSQERVMQLQEQQLAYQQRQQVLLEQQVALLQMIAQQTASLRNIEEMTLLIAAGLEHPAAPMVEAVSTVEVPTPPPAPTPTPPEPPPTPPEPPPAPPEKPPAPLPPHGQSVVIPLPQSDVIPARPRTSPVFTPTVLKVPTITRYETTSIPVQSGVQLLGSTVEVPTLSANDLAIVDPSDQHPTLTLWRDVVDMVWPNGGAVPIAGIVGGIKTRYERKIPTLCRQLGLADIMAIETEGKHNTARTLQSEFRRISAKHLQLVIIWAAVMGSQMKNQAIGLAKDAGLPYVLISNLGNTVAIAKTWLERYPRERRLVEARHTGHLDT